MTTDIESTPEPSGLAAWFPQFLKSELEAYPGRGVVVARMVIAATITILLIPGRPSADPGDLPFGSALTEEGIPAPHAFEDRQSNETKELPAISSPNGYR